MVVKEDEIVRTCSRNGEDCIQDVGRKKTEGNIPLGSPGRRYYNNIKMYRREIGWTGVGFTCRFYRVPTMVYNTWN
jgi:hypothetical protein